MRFVVEGLTRIPAAGGWIDTALRGRVMGEAGPQIHGGYRRIYSQSPSR